MAGSSQSAFKLNLHTLSPEPASWAWIKVSQKPDPQVGQSRMASQSPESVRKAVHSSVPKSSLTCSPLHPQDLSSFSTVADLT